MKVEIWSDIACPFCYIGKEHFERALADFADAEDIEVIYKSYQLDPSMNYEEGRTAVSYLVDKKGMPAAQIEQMMDRIVHMAADTGLTMNFKTNLPANTIDAHRLIHLAKKHGKDKEVIRLLFESHFTNGENIEDKEILKNIALNAGLDENDTQVVLDSYQFMDEVNADIAESRKFGVNGVPFFVFDRKYAVSGAQPVESFKGAIEKSFSEWRKENPKFESLNTTDGAACTDGSCEI